MDRLKRSLLLGFLLFFLSGLFAQGSIEGKVQDPNGNPVVGATVTIPAAQLGAYTDDNGRFNLQNVPSGEATVNVTYIGFLTQTQTVTVSSGGTARLNFTMEEEVLETEEVVIVGYGTQRKRELVGNVVKINTEDLNDNIGASFETALQGKAVGVQVTQSSGVAGSGSVIRIRGVGSLSSGGDPLYVVDGIPITQDYFLLGESGGQNNNPLSSINPADIESIEVLKDASAAAIYGSRGSNGVILITTKRGKKGKPQIDFNARVGLSQPTRLIEMLDAGEWVQIQQEAWENDGNTGRAPLPQNLTYEDIEGTDTDWYDHTVQTGVKQEYNLSVRQGTEKLNTYFGIGYSDAESYLIGNSYQRVSGRLNVDYKILKNLEVGLSTSLARGDNSRVANAWAGGLGYAQSTALPIYPVKDSEGNWFNLYGNPVAQRELTEWNVKEWRSINNLKLNYTPVKGLNFNVTGNYDYLNINDLIAEDSLWTTVGKITKDNTQKINNWSSYATGQYDFSFANPDHSLSILLGAEYQQSNHFGINYEFQPDTTFGGEEFDIEKWKFASIFSRVNYTWRSKVMLQATYRRDGSSKFGTNSRFGNFPSFGVGYILSEEPFFKNNVVNYLKFKASWGITGNADIAWTQQFPIYYPNNIGGIDNSPGYNSNPTQYQIKLENPDLQWEVANTVDAGFEIGLFQDRLTAEFTYYYKLTSKAIILTAIQASSGIDDLVFAQNVGKIRNNGIEAGIVSRNLVGPFSWTTRINLAHNRNEVLDVGTATPDALDGGFGDTRAVPGYPVNTNFIVRWLKVDPMTGRPVYLTRDGQETSIYDVVQNRVPAGDGMPWLVGGITNEFKYRNFDMSFLFSFSLGGQIYDDAAKRHLGVVTEDWNFRKEIFDRWQKPGDIAMYPQLTRSMINWGGNANFWQNNHTLWLEDASFLRLKTLELGYNINQFGNAPIRAIRVALSGTNLLTFTEYRGNDPEIARDRTSAQQRNIGGTNITYLTPPQERTYNLSINVQF
jgi:TonB-linked SusC/RagA family outer membrane protein